MVFEKSFGNICRHLTKLALLVWIDQIYRVSECCSWRNSDPIHIHTIVQCHQKRNCRDGVFKTSSTPTWTPLLYIHMRYTHINSQIPNSCKHYDSKAIDIIPRNRWIHSQSCSLQASESHEHISIGRFELT
jgi:hypothetical protein